MKRFHDSLAAMSFIGDLAKFRRLHARMLRRAWHRAIAKGDLAAAYFYAVLAGDVNRRGS